MKPISPKDFAQMGKIEHRRPMRRIEQTSQIGVLNWWKMACRGFGVDERLMAHVPNAAKRGIIEGAMMKRMGTRKGWPDLQLMCPRGGYHALMIEMKSPDGVVSQDQVQMIALLRGQGYCVEVCYDLMSAINTVTNYLTARAAS